MKKKLYIIVGIILIVLAALVFVWFDFSNEKVSDGLKFKEEYEVYNDKTSASGMKYQSLDIPKDNKVKYASLEDVIEVISSGTGLIYFGFPNCPWCRGMLPSLLESSKDERLDSVLYVDMTDLRDTYEIVDGEAVKTKDASESYYRLLELLGSYLDDYKLEISDEEISTNEKRVYVPLVVGVKNGKIVSAMKEFVSLNENQTSYDEYTKEQKEELITKFNEVVDAMFTEEEPAVCDTGC